MRCSPVLRINAERLFSKSPDSCAFGGRRTTRKRRLLSAVRFGDRPSSRRFLPMNHSIGAATITCRNSSASKSYWTKTRQGIKLVNALSEESVGQTNHGLEANPTTDSSLKPSRGECSPASRSPRDDFSDACFSGLQWCLSGKDQSAQTVETSDGRRCYNSQSGEHRRSDFSPGDGAHGKEEVSEPQA